MKISTSYFYSSTAVCYNGGQHGYPRSRVLLQDFDITHTGPFTMVENIKSNNDNSSLFLSLQPVGFVTFSTRAGAEAAKQDLQVRTATPNSTSQFSNLLKRMMMMHKIAGSCIVL